MRIEKISKFKITSYVLGIGPADVLVRPVALTAFGSEASLTVQCTISRLRQGLTLGYLV